MQERIKEHDRDIRLSRTQTSAVSEHTNETGHLPIWREVKFTDHDPHWYTCRVKEAIHIRLHPNNLSRDSGIEIPEAWIATVPLKSIGAFSAILPRWNRSFYLRFDLGKTSSNFFENSGFTSVFCGQEYRGKE